MKMPFLTLLFLLAACSPSKPSDFRSEGERWAIEMADELKRLETKEDVERAKPRLKRRYHQLADLLLEVAAWKRSHPRERPSFEPSEASAALYQEMARLQELPGAEEVLNGCRREALKKLDRGRETKPLKD